MKEVIDKSIIKLPSDTKVVTTSTLWQFVKSISTAGNEFDKEQLKRAGLYTKSENTISRNLAYLKYLGFMEEARIKPIKGSTNTQKFKVISDDETVKDLIYQLKSNREEDAKKKWNILIEHSQLWIAVKNRFFTDDDSKTKIDFENFLKKEVGSQNPTYIQEGEKFVIQLLVGSGLIIKDNDLFKVKNTSTVNPISDETHESLDVINPEIDKQSKFYIVKIQGPSINTTVEIRDEKQMNVVNAIIDLIKNELSIE